MSMMPDSYVHMRKKRNVRSVMGWLLSFQLSAPGAGVCWAVSMVCEGGGRRVGGVNGELHVASGSGTRLGRQVGVWGRELWSQLRASPHVIGYVLCPRCYVFFMRLRMLRHLNCVFDSGD
jgi:hypothetical protein